VGGNWGEGYVKGKRMREGGERDIYENVYDHLHITYFYYFSFSTF